MTLVNLVIANLKVICRNRQAVFWALAFPLLFVVVFGLFVNGESQVNKIAMVDLSNDSLSVGLFESLSSVKALEVELHVDEIAARRAFEDGELSFVVIVPENFSEVT